MGFHLEESSISDGTIDNRVKGRTVVRINFTNHTSSIITLQGNPCRDLAGSLWKFHNPHARMDEVPGEPCYFVPPLCEGTVGRISHTSRREVPVLPPEEHYDRLFDPDQADPPVEMAPVLELEWFSQKFKQVEIDCQCMKLELVEMAWVLPPEEAAQEEAIVDQTRDEIERYEGGTVDGFHETMELVEEWLEDAEPHELEELCLLIVQEYIIDPGRNSEQQQELHNDLLKLQEQISGAFVHLEQDGQFADIRATVSLLSGTIPFIDRTIRSAQFVAETTAENLHKLREGVITLREELVRSAG